MIVIKKAKKHPQIRVCCAGVVDATPPQCSYIAIIMAVNRAATLASDDFGRCPLCERPLLSVPPFSCHLKDVVDRVERTLAASKREEFLAGVVSIAGYPAPVITVDAPTSARTPKFVHARCNSAVVANEKCDFEGVVTLAPILPACPSCGRHTLYQFYGR